jgi:hypothetical protein
MEVPRFRRRLWSEMVPFETLRDPRVLARLRRFGMGLIAAVRPWQLDAAPSLVATCRDAGISLSLWPMLADDEGRWANSGNIDRFGSFVRALVERLGDVPTDIALDLEPDIRGPTRFLAGGSFASTPDTRDSTRTVLDPRAALRDLVDALHERGCRVSSAVVPLVLFDRERDDPGWESLLGTPVRGVPFDEINAMLYTSMLEGWSRGLLRRRDARSLLDRSCRAAVRRYGARASVSLGLVDVGVYGNEPIYDDVTALEDDVAIARAAGVDDLVLYDLGGVLARPPAERWLDAFVHTPAAVRSPPETMRARVAARAAGALGVLAGRATSGRIHREFREVRE